VVLHQLQRIGQRRFRPDGQRVHHHAAFVAFDAPHMLGLFFDGEVFVDHPHAAGLRHGDGERGLGDGVHRGGNQRNAKLDGLGQARTGVDLAGQNVGGCGHQQNIVEGQSFPNRAEYRAWRALLFYPRSAPPVGLARPAWVRLCAWGGGLGVRRWARDPISGALSL
jgi:hypothetical protein